MVDCAQGGEDQEGPGHQQAGRDDDAEGPAGGKLSEIQIYHQLYQYLYRI